jgi:hypothetical protein
MVSLGAGWVFAAVVTASVLAAPQTIRVTIDVKPGDNPTTIEPDRGGLLPVAVLSTAKFDASTIDPQTILIGPTGTEAEPFRSMSEDVDRDGKADLMILVRVLDMKAKCGHKLIRLTGKTKAGDSIEGSEDVTMEGCSK